MTPAARLAATIDCLTEILAAEKPADTVMSAFFRNRRYIGSSDRAAVAENIYRILRRYFRLSWWLQRIGRETINARALLFADLLLGEKWKVPRLDDYFSDDRYAAKPLSYKEREWVPLLEGGDLMPPEMPDAVRVECPPEAAARLQPLFGDRFGEEMAAMTFPAPLDLRVNTLISDRAAVLDIFKKMGVQADPTPYSPWGIRIKSRPALGQMDSFKKGAFEIQDEGSQLIGLLVGAQPGMQVVDFCAGAGGKTLAIAATMQNKGRLIACDVLEGRLIRSRERITRAHADNIQIRPLASENDKWVKRSGAIYDRVLVDAPCSGTGVWRRNPDARWKQLGPEVAELVALQARILNSAARLVKPGGRLIYATCSLLPDENQNQIETFLAAHPEFSVVPLAQVWSETIAQMPEGQATPPCAGNMLSLTPAQHQTDGFFGAILERKM